MSSEQRSTGWIANRSLKVLIAHMLWQWLNDSNTEIVLTVREQTFFQKRPEACLSFIWSKNSFELTLGKPWLGVWGEFYRQFKMKTRYVAMKMALKPQGGSPTCDQTAENAVEHWQQSTINAITTAMFLHMTYISIYYAVLHLGERSNCEVQHTDLDR